jgi:hypothetical protein
MEYLTNCPECKRHTIIKTTKVIENSTTRKPQRVAKCVRCGKTARETIIGEVTTTNVIIDPFAEFARGNALKIKFW